MVIRKWISIDPCICRKLNFWTPHMMYKGYCVTIPWVRQANYEINNRLHPLFRHCLWQNAHPLHCWIIAINSLTLNVFHLFLPVVLQCKFGQIWQQSSDQCYTYSLKDHDMSQHRASLTFTLNKLPGSSTWSWDLFLATMPELLWHPLSSHS